MDDIRLTYNDAALMRAVAAGDPGAFQEVKERYLDLVSRTSFRILCDREDSETVTVQVFCRILDYASDYDGCRPLTEWILAATCRLCHIRLIRRMFLRIFALFPDVYVTSSPELPWEDDYISKKAWEIYCRSCMKLSYRQRVIYILCELEGMSVSQVHYITGLRPSSILYCLEKARERIKKELNRYGKVR